MDGHEERILAFVRTAIISVWALELLLALKRGRDRRWPVDRLVGELRSSEVAVREALASLESRGLVTRDGDGLYRYAPSSPELARQAEDVEALYTAKPLAVIRAIFEAPDEKLRVFARSFRLKDKEP